MPVPLCKATLASITLFEFAQLGAISSYLVNGSDSLPQLRLLQLLRKQKAEFDTLDKPSPLMIPAKRTDRINDPIHLPQIHAVHLSVQFFKVRFGLGIIQSVILAICLIQQRQHRVPIPKIGHIPRNMLFQHLNDILHIYLQDSMKKTV